MKYTQINIGTEIECLINEQIHNFKTGSFSNPKKLKNSKFWFSKTDGSLYADNTTPFRLSKCLEFVSCVFKSKSKFFRAIDEFIKIMSNNGEYKLNDVLNINQSCGNHIHISLSNNKKFNNFLDYEILKEMREYFFKLLEDNKIISKDTKQKITEQYFRNYAKKTTKRHFNINPHFSSRSKEFNIRSESINKGLEWRSFNLNGVKNWLEFKEMFKIGFKCVEFLFKKRTKGYILKKQNFKFNKLELKREFKKIEENKNKVVFIDVENENKNKVVFLDVKKDLSDLNFKINRFERFILRNNDDDNNYIEEGYIYNSSGDEIGYINEYDEEVFY